MNITKVLAEEVANKMVEPLEKKINLLHDEQVRITEEVIRKSIPQEITDCFQKFRYGHSKESKRISLRHTDILPAMKIREKHPYPCR